MKIYFPIAKVDAERREVWGYASTEARDEQGETVKREALIAALGDYMKFANIREMHQLSAVGIAKEAAVDDKGLYIGAKIVDDQAWQKVVEGVYKGYSIGGRVTERDPRDFKTITGLVLNEISLVDRPANPEAVFDYWKAAGSPRMPEAELTPPIQIWSCGVSHHNHLAKSEALKCQQQKAGCASDLIAAATTAIATAEGALAKAQTRTEDRLGYGDVEYADPGYQADGKKRYPIDTEQHIRAAWNFINRPRNAQRYSTTELSNIKARIIAAWKAKIDTDGPPLAAAGKSARPFPQQRALEKALCDVGHIARIILDLDWLQESLAVEAMMEGDDSRQPARLQSIIAELCAFLNALVAEETGEIMDGAEMLGEPDHDDAAAILVRAAGVPGAAHLAALCQGRGRLMQKLAAAVFARAKHSDGDQALLDLAYHAIDKCLAIDGLLFAERSHMAIARDALKAAGAAAEADREFDQPAGQGVETSASVQPRSGSAAGQAAAPDRRSPGNSAAPEMLEMISAALGKRGSGHQALMDLAHDCIGKLTDGVCCMAAKAGARHSRETLDHLTKAHDHLVAAGASCEGSPAQAEGESGKSVSKIASGHLSKILAEERSEKAALIATLTEIVPRLDQLAKRVEDIARTPLPPRAVAKGVAAISKQQDSAGSPISADDLAAAFSQMSREDQTLTLIKASYARPIHPPGLAPAKDTRGE
jgi:phage head maturation protease